MPESTPTTDNSVQHAAASTQPSTSKVEDLRIVKYLDTTADTTQDSQEVVTINDDTEIPAALEPEKEKPKQDEKRKREPEMTPVEWGQPLVPPSKETVLGTQLREILIKTGKDVSKMKSIDLQTLGREMKDFFKTKVKKTAPVDRKYAKTVITTAEYKERNTKKFKKDTGYASSASIGHQDTPEDDNKSTTSS